MQAAKTATVIAKPKITACSVDCGSLEGNGVGEVVVVGSGEDV